MLTATGCTTTVFGEGAPETSPTQTAGTDPGPDVTEPPAIGSSGAPLDIEALFAPPTGQVTSSDSIFGLWATAGTETESRIRVLDDEVTIAQRCRADGQIAFVVAKTRSTSTKIMLLESRADRRSPDEPTRRSSCTLDLQVRIGEWLSCSEAHAFTDDCWEILDGKLMGPERSWKAAGVPAGYWFKLSD